MATKKNTPLKPELRVETLKHDSATRKNIPTAEYQSVMAKDEQKSVRVEYARRNRDLDPQLVWRGKDEQDWSDLVVHAPPLYIQEKVHPKVLVDDLKRESERRREATAPRAEQVDLFADFNGLPNDGAKTEFYQHDAHWANRMILGDSLAVMASLAEREGLRGKVQCIYFDPPYGIKFNSNFQWSTTSRDVKDGNVEHITREPEQEFRAVVVMACDDEIIPLQARIQSVADNADLEEVYNTERHLLYVACTRARDHLFITSVKPGSAFLEDMRVVSAKT